MVMGIVQSLLLLFALVYNMVWRPRAVHSLSAAGLQMRLLCAHF